MLSFADLPDSPVIDRIEAEITRCLAIATRHFGRSFPRPRLLYDLCGRTAGTANCSRWRIRLNATLLRTRTEEMIRDVVPHELAHLIDGAMYPQNLAPRPRIRGRRTPRVLHGATWKAIMRLFEVEPNRCHTLPVEPARVHVRRRYEYRCPQCARVILVGPRHHAALQRRKMTARLKQCGHLIFGFDCIGLSAATQEALAAREAKRRVSRS